MSSAAAPSRRTGRGRRAAWVAVGFAILAVVVLVALVARFVTSAHDTRTDIRDAAAAHWHVRGDQVEVERFTTHDRCAVAEVSLRVAGTTKTAVIATETRNGSTVVNRERGERFFDTDDPDWAYTCPGSPSDGGA